MKRVVITGMGTINPLGSSVEEFWTNIINGKSVASSIQKFDASLHRTQFACEIDQEKVKERLSLSEIKRADPYTQYGLISTQQAIIDSGIAINDMDPYDIGVIWGTGQAGLSSIESELGQHYQKEDKKPHFHPLFIPKMLGSITAGQIALKFGVKGVAFTNHAACASANAALMDASLYIKSDKAKVMIVGASDAPITEATFAGFNALRALSCKNEDPASASKPFDRYRDGFVVAEGSGTLILEEYEHALKRGATIYAELAACSVTNDAFHLTANDPSGKAATKAIELVLKESKINIEDVDYLNPHATSTPTGDLAELQVIRNLWQGSKKPLKMSATKSMTGHHLGASGIIEAIICIQAIKDQLIPPTINSQKENLEKLPDGVNLILKESIDCKVKIAINSSFGFGGHNAISLFKAI